MYRIVECGGKYYPQYKKTLENIRGLVGDENIYYYLSWNVFNTHIIETVFTRLDAPTIVGCQTIEEAKGFIEKHKAQKSGPKVIWEES